MSLKIAFWFCGLVTSSIMGGFIGYFVARDSGIVFGVPGGVFAFVTWRLGLILHRQNSN